MYPVTLCGFTFSNTEKGRLVTSFIFETLNNEADFGQRLINILKIGQISVDLQEKLIQEVLRIGLFAIDFEDSAEPTYDIYCFSSAKFKELSLVLHPNNHGVRTILDQESSNIETYMEGLLAQGKPILELIRPHLLKVERFEFKGQTPEDREFECWELMDNFFKEDNYSLRCQGDVYYIQIWNAEKETLCILEIDYSRRLLILSEGYVKGRQVFAFDRPFMGDLRSFFTRFYTA